MTETPKPPIEHGASLPIECTIQLRPVTEAREGSDALVIAKYSDGAFRPTTEDSIFKGEACVVGWFPAMIPQNTLSPRMETLSLLDLVQRMGPRIRAWYHGQMKKIAGGQDRMLALLAEAEICAAKGYLKDVIRTVKVIEGIEINLSDGATISEPVREIYDVVFQDLDEEFDAGVRHEHGRWDASEPNIQNIRVDEGRSGKDFLAQGLPSPEDLFVVKTRMRQFVQTRRTDSSKPNVSNEQRVESELFAQRIFAIVQSLIDHGDLPSGAYWSLRDFLDGVEACASNRKTERYRATATRLKELLEKLDDK
jgi:hypothetical protein